MAIHVCRVSGNAKGGSAWDLGEKTIIVGPNGSGKSRIVNLLELALSGYASDIVGRPRLSQGADLITLTAPGEDLRAEVKLSDGSVGFFLVERNGPGKTKKPVHSPPAGVEVSYPLTDAVAALRGSVDTAKLFVLRYSGVDASDEAITGRLPASARDLYSTFLSAQSGEGVEGLIGVWNDAKKTAKSANAGAKQATAVIDRVGATLPTLRPSDDDTAAARAKLDKALSAREAAKNATKNGAGAVPNVAGARLAAENAISRLDALEKGKTATQAQLDAHKKQHPGAQEGSSGHRLQDATATLLEAYSTEATWKPGQTMPCVLCGGAVALDASTLSARAESIRSDMQAVATTTTLTETLRTLHTDVQEAHTTATQAVDVYRAAQQELERQQQNPIAVIDPATRQRLDAEVTAAYGELEALTTAAASWGTVQQARDTLEDARKTASDAKLLAMSCKDVIDALVEDGRAGFMSRVQQYLPATDEFMLQLRDGSRSVCRFGFVRDGMLHSALSGAEWSRLTLALGAATAPVGPSTLAILTPEERAYDPGALQSVLKALLDAPGQVIITSPIRPKGRILKGWTLIETGEAT